MFRSVSTNRYIRLLPRLVPLLAVLALLAACGQTAAGAVAPPQERTIYMAAIEPKGGTTVDKEPFPAQSLPPGGGYGLKAPDDTGRWQVETYRFDTGTVVVNEGDTVTMEIVGINGKEHLITVEGYGLSIVERVPLVAGLNEHNRDYLRTKVEKMGHIIDVDPLVEPDPIGEMDDGDEGSC